MIVLDASVGLKWVLPEKDTPKAVKLRNEYRKGLYDLLAPDLFPLEIANALSKAERKKIIRDARRRFILVMGTSPILQPYAPLLDRALEISLQTKSAVPDCTYIALAEREGCDMVSADEKLVNNVEKQFPFVKLLSKF
jgi:predicted nucleic acid-binding protein